MCAFVVAAQAAAQTIPKPTKPQDTGANKPATVHTFQPRGLPPPPVSALRVPEGFKIVRFAENLGNARMLAVGPSGAVYVTRPEQGDVLMIETGPDGLAAGKPERVASRAGDGQPTRFEPFVSGFVTGEGECGCVAGNAVAADGSLLFTDNRNGVIYRVSRGCSRGRVKAGGGRPRSRG